MVRDTIEYKKDHMFEMQRKMSRHNDHRRGRGFDSRSNLNFFKALILPLVVFLSCTFYVYRSLKLALNEFNLSS